MNVIDLIPLEEAERLASEQRQPEAEHSSPRFITVSLPELQALQLPIRDMVLMPILPSKGIGMLVAQRGIGKTFVGLNVGYAVATGCTFLKWTAPRPRKVLYIDGEMPVQALQERVNMLVQSSSARLRADHFRFLAMDMQELGCGLNLARAEDQAAIEDELGEAEFLVLDNLSTLVSAGRENDAESWDAMQTWLLRLRRRGVTVLLVHHAGRSGEPRGSSKREDVLDTVIRLTRPQNYQPVEGARFEVHLTKARGIYGEDAAPFEAQLQQINGEMVWTVKSVTDNEVEQVVELTNARMSVRDIADELGMSKSKVARLQGKAREAGGLQ